MIGLKIFLFATLMAVAASSPSPCLFGHGCGSRSVDHGFHGIGHGRRTYRGRGILGCFGYFARGVTSKIQHTVDIFTDLANLKDCGSFDDSLTVLLRVSRASSSIIDHVFPGVGNLLFRMVMTSIRIVVCVLGLQPRHGKHFNHGICDSDYGKGWGWERYGGRYGCADDVIDGYALSGVHADLEILLKKYSKNRGLDGFTGSQRLIFENIWDICGLFKRPSKRWCHKDLFTISFKVIVIIGTLGNSHHSGLGDYIVDGLIGYCGDSFKEYGYSEFLTCGDDIKKQLSKCDRDDFNGAVVIANDDDHSDDEEVSDDNSNESNSDSNQSNKKHSDSNQSNKKHSGSNQSNKKHSGSNNSNKKHSGSNQSNKNHSGSKQSNKNNSDSDQSNENDSDSNQSNENDSDSNQSNENDSNSNQSNENNSSSNNRNKNENTIIINNQVNVYQNQSQNVNEQT